MTSPTRTQLVTSLRRAVLAAAGLALLLAPVHYVVGIPSRGAGGPLGRFSVATQTSGALVLDVFRPAAARGAFFDARWKRMQPALLGGAYRLPVPDLLLVALGNAVVLAPLLYLVLRGLQRWGGGGAAPSGAPDPRHG
jgi:hypothetical protein